MITEARGIALKFDTSLNNAHQQTPLVRSVLIGFAKIHPYLIITIILLIEISASQMRVSDKL